MEFLSSKRKGKTGFIEFKWNIIFSRVMRIFFSRTSSEPMGFLYVTLHASNNYNTKKSRGLPRRNNWRKLISANKVLFCWKYEQYLHVLYNNSYLHRASGNTLWKNTHFRSAQFFLKCFVTRLLSFIVWK